MLASGTPLPDGSGPPDANIACGSDAAPCPNADPVCGGGACAGCSASTDCRDELPICLTLGGQCSACTSEQQCSDRGGPPHCATSGACVACRDSNDCSGNTPFCGAGNVCRGCEADGECASGSECDDVSGACVTDANVIFVDAAGTATSTCDKTAPCGKLADGINQVNSPRTLVHVAAGSYMESPTINKSMDIVGRGLPSLNAMLLGMPVVTITGGTVGIAGLDVNGAMGAAASTPDGVSCTKTATLTLVRDRIDGNGRFGVFQQSDCQLTVEQSRIFANAVGGLSISATVPFTIVNDVIEGNGTATTALGGVTISSPPTGSVLAFDTITANHAASGVAGVSCSLGVFGGDSDIVYGNTGGAAVDTTFCSWTFSDIDQAVGGSNYDVDPKLTTDFHLMGDSPCIDKANGAATLKVDLDGDKRPARAGFDIGADEVP
jgi:hypothetical protein